jgi:hypothetical protein
LRRGGNAFYTRAMSEKIIAMAFMRLREAGKVSEIRWDDIVAHDPTGRLASLRGLARKEALESATRRCGIGRRPRTDIYDFLDVRTRRRTPSARR